MPTPPTQREYWSGKVGGEWAAHADRIDAMLAPVTNAALALAAFRPGERVLDIGCGAGATSLEIARAVGDAGDVVGVDLSPQLLSVARGRMPAGAPLKFMEADAGAADLGACFNAAFSRFGVMFFERPVDAFAHIRNAMCEGGRIAFVCWRPLAENGWSSAAIASIAPMLKAPLAAPDPDAPGPFSLADRGKIERVLSAAGWRDIAITRWDGDIAIGGGGTLAETADFMLKIGPCARAIADQDLDANEARQRVMDHLSPHQSDTGVFLPAACWIVRAGA